jgi:hypothetical protein
VSVYGFLHADQNCDCDAVDRCVSELLFLLFIFLLIPSIFHSERTKGESQQSCIEEGRMEFGMQIKLGLSPHTDLRMESVFLYFTRDTNHKWSE